MNFITVRPGIKLRKENISKIRKIDDIMKCEVFCDGEWVVSDYPYESLGMLLEIGNIEEQISTTAPTDNPSTTRNLYGAQHWAG